MGKREPKICCVLFSGSPALRESVWCFQIELKKKCVAAAPSLTQPSLAQGREILIFEL
jgi:hypothetical protein